MSTCPSEHSARQKQLARDALNHLVQYMMARGDDVALQCLADVAKIGHPARTVLEEIRDSGMAESIEKRRQKSKEELLDVLNYSMCSLDDDVYSVEKISEWMDQGVSPNTKNMCGKSVLMLACRMGEVHLVKKIIRLGADVNAVVDYDSLPALAYATNVDVARELLAAGAVIKNGVLKRLLSLGLEDVAMFLVDRGADVDVDDRDHLTVLMHACLADAKSFIEKIVGRVDVNARDIYGRTALMLLVAEPSTSSEDVFELLVRYGARLDVVDNDGKTLLMYANPRMIQMLIDHGMDIHAKNSKGMTPLTHAVCRGDISVGMKLLALGVRADESTSSGKTALMCCRHPAMINVLIKYGADVDARDPKGQTALMMRAAGDDTEAVRTLLEHGADVNARDLKGRTALMAACRKAPSNMVSALLDRGADVNARDHKGYTALMVASHYSYPDVVNILLDRGADVNALDNQKNSALRWAKNTRAGWEQTAIIKMLREAGCP